MKTVRSVLVLAVAALSVGGASTLIAQQPAAGGQAQRAPAPRVSPPAVSGMVVEGNRVTVYYAKVGVKDPKTKEDRKIWGGLVPFGKVWRLGANEATLLTTEKPITIGSVEVPAGAHSLYMWPNEDGSAKLIINKQVGQWGATYNESMDLGRVDLTKAAQATPNDALTITVGRGEGGAGGVIKIAFADAEYSVPFTVKK